MMSQGDSWSERYLAVVPEKLTAEDAQILLDLIRESPEGFLAALQEFIENSRDDDGEEVAEDA